MRSPRNLHALLIVITLLGFGVATVGFVIRRRARNAHPEAAESPAASAPSRSPASLEKPPASAATTQVSAPKAQPSPNAPPVIPPNLARTFEKRYRFVSPADMQVARAQLEDKLRLQTASHAPEPALQELRCEIQWILERTVNDEGREEGPKR